MPRTFRALCCVVTALVACASTPAPPPAPIADLAPSGKLRATIDYGNPILAAKDTVTGQPRGVSVDFSRELAARLGAGLELVTFEAAGKVVEAARSGAWDVAFVAIDPACGQDVLQSPPCVIIEGAHRVAADSPIRRNEDVDREGVRGAVGKGSAYDLFPSRQLEHARIVCAPTSPAVTDLFIA